MIFVNMAGLFVSDEVATIGLMQSLKFLYDITYKLPAFLLLLTHIDTAIQSVARFPIRGLSGFIIAMYL